MREEWWILRRSAGFFARTFLLLLVVASVPGIAIGQQAGEIGKIAFHSSNGDFLHIFIMGTNGSGRTQLTHGASSNFAPQISPDGSQIVFVSDRSGTEHLYLMEIDGENQRRLTNSPFAEEDPTWSPKGSQIFFRQELGDRRVVVCTVNSDGTGFRQLTDGSARYLRPEVSPDGTMILAVSISGGSELQILDVDGKNPRKVPNAPAGTVFASWAPDGERIVLATATPPPDLSADIHLLRLDGSGHVQLTKGEGINEYPCWSPDGERIAFQTSRDGNFEIYIIDADGGDPRRVTEYPGLDGRPSWR